MCGIIAYSGTAPGIPVCMDGLERLEYRGYDSAGLAYVENGAIRVVKEKGKVAVLGRAVAEQAGRSNGSAVLAHTRWATHGEPSRRNAHPHLDGGKRLAMVHNGIIENYRELRSMLEEKGHCFASTTDSEVLVKLIGHELERCGSVEEALGAALEQVEGSYAIVLINRDEPDRLWGARNMSPLVLGVGDTDCYLASDVPAFLAHTRKVVHIEDREIVEISKGFWRVVGQDGRTRSRTCSHVDWDVQAARKGGHPHFMIKEILEQPRVIRDTLAGRLDPDTLELTMEELEAGPVPGRLIILACGTSYYAGLWAKYYMERLAEVPVEVHVASEFRYCAALIEPGAQVLVISQSGETADTLAGLRLARSRGVQVLGLCNVVGSTVAREADKVLFTRAGPEISVASTKAMCSQMMMLLLQSILYAQRKGLLENGRRRELLSGLLALPGLLERSLPQMRARAAQLAAKYATASNFFYLGRAESFPLAMEGALKLKEISYIHAEGYPAGEMKHGPIALVDERFPTMALAFANELYPKVKSNLEEVQARGGPIIALVNPGHDLEVDDVWELPAANGPLASFLALPALQLFAYEAAVALGKDVDQPRNLAKSVTVE